jgi:hypothetical protein
MLISFGSILLLTEMVVVFPRLLFLIVYFRELS